jgi:hypothetical protein
MGWLAQVPAMKQVGLNRLASLGGFRGPMPWVRSAESGETSNKTIPTPIYQPMAKHGVGAEIALWRWFLSPWFKKLP